MDREHTRQREQLGQRPWCENKHRTSSHYKRTSVAGIMWEKKGVIQEDVEVRWIIRNLSCFSLSQITLSCLLSSLPLIMKGLCKKSGCYSKSNRKLWRRILIKKWDDLKSNFERSQWWMRCKSTFEEASKQISYCLKKEGVINPIKFHTEREWALTCVHWVKRKSVMTSRREVLGECWRWSKTDIIE